MRPIAATPNASEQTKATRPTATNELTNDETKEVTVHLMNCHADWATQETLMLSKERPDFWVAKGRALALMDGRGKKARRFA